MITIKHIIPPVIKLYSPDDSFIGDVLNEYEAAEIRTQIAREKLSGYYFIGLDRHGNSVKSNISDTGDIDVLLTQWQLLLEYLRELTEIKRSKPPLKTFIDGKPVSVLELEVTDIPKIK